MSNYIELRFGNGPEMTQREVVRAENIVSFYIVLPHRRDLAITFKVNGEECTRVEHFDCQEECYGRYISLLDWLEVKHSDGMRFLPEGIEDEDAWVSDEAYKSKTDYVEEVYRRYIKRGETTNWGTIWGCELYDAKKEIQEAAEEIRKLKLRKKDWETDDGPTEDEEGGVGD